MSGIIDCEMHIGDEVFVHGYIDEIRNDTIIIRNVGGYFGTSRNEVFYYEEDERGYGTMNEADRKTENCSEKPNNSTTEDCSTVPTISKMEQVDKDINARSKDESKTQMKTQNSNLTFEKADEPQADWETEKRDNSLCYKCVKECDGRVLNRYTIECNQYEPKDEPQTMYYPQVDGITPSVIEPKFDKDINVRSKYKQGTWLYGDGVYCSCCGYKLETTALLAKCPKCGADMSKTDCAWKKGE